jgi:hypothetical protein
MNCAQMLDRTHQQNMEQRRFLIFGGLIRWAEQRDETEQGMRWGLVLAQYRSPHFDRLSSSAKKGKDQCSNSQGIVCEV